MILQRKDVDTTALLNSALHMLSKTQRTLLFSKYGIPTQLAHEAGEAYHFYIGRGFIAYNTEHKEHTEQEEQ